ncbi:MAG: DUF3109 family protein [Ignavibacteriaceae bacterium]|nr:DUF3109 family protein [Ignavibacteriaceae bacterium]
MFYEIDNVLVNALIGKMHFECDLPKCKGACCTFEGKYGAPITEGEIEDINRNIESVLPLLPEKHLKVISEKGFYQEIDGELFTQNFEDRACVFVYYDTDIAKCGIENAYFNKKSDFRKPISCHLFPIRVSNFGGEALRYEEYDVCSPALEKGIKNNVRLVTFSADSLTRKYDKQWYDKFAEIVK